MPIRILILLTLPLAVYARPNIVFILADDLGWNDVGYHDSEIKTPNIDSLAEDGLNLDRYYAFPMCSPTRAAFLTGRSPIRLGIVSPIGPRGGLPLQEHLLSETLQSDGYQTSQVGKWHLGMDRVAAHAYNRGFSHSYGHLGPSVDYFTHVWQGALDWQRNGKALREEGYTTELITAEAIRQIKSRDESAPMFLYVAFNAPHSPLQAPEQYVTPYAHIEDANRKIYAAMVTAMDEGVGRILETLADEGIADDTLVVWASDNGGGTNLGASNRPFKGGKGNAFEGGIRVPAAIRWPGVLPAGQRIEQMVTAMDWFPTLTSAVGVKPRNSLPFDGVDMWPALKDGGKVARPDTVIGVAGNYAVFRDGWKYVQSTRRNRNESETFLYRITDDPLEARNLIETESELANQLRAVIEAIPKARSASQGRRRGPGNTVGGPRPGRNSASGGRQQGRPGRRNAQGGRSGEPWVERAARD